MGFSVAYSHPLVGWKVYKAHYDSNPTMRNLFCFSLLTISADVLNYLNLNYTVSLPYGEENHTFRNAMRRVAGKKIKGREIKSDSTIYTPVYFTTTFGVTQSQNTQSSLTIHNHPVSSLKPFQPHLGKPKSYGGQDLFHRQMIGQESVFAQPISGRLRGESDIRRARFKTGIYSKFRGPWKYDLGSWIKREQEGQRLAFCWDGEGAADWSIKAK